MSISNRGHSWRSLLLCSACVTIFIITYFVIFCWTSSGFRFYREYGVNLPLSASHLTCYGDAATKILDRTAGCSFEMGKNEFDSFRHLFPDAFYFQIVKPFCDNPLSGCRGCWSNGESIVSKSDYRFNHNKLYIKFKAKSKTGGDICVESYESLYDKTILVIMSCDWN